MGLSDADVTYLFLGLQRRAEAWETEAREASSLAEVDKCLAHASTIRWVLREIECRQMYAQQRLAASRGRTIAAALSGAAWVLSASRNVPSQALRDALDDKTAYELIRSGEYEPTLTEVFQIASVLRVSPEVLVAATVRRLESLGDAGRDVLLDYVGLGRIYVLEIPSNGATPAHGEAYLTWLDCFRVGRTRNKERRANGEPPITTIAVYARITEVPLT